MNESALYNESDLAPFQKRIRELRAILQRDATEGKHPQALLKLLERQINKCGAFRRQVLVRGVDFP